MQPPAPTPSPQETKLAALGRVVEARPAEPGDLGRELAGTAVLVVLLLTSTGGLLAAVFAALWMLS